MRGLAAFLLALVAGIAPSTAPRADLRGVTVPMRDGVKLRSDVLKPAGDGKFSTLVYRTPYDRKDVSEDVVLAAALSAGYAVVRVDVRGRYDSEGEFTPYRAEGRDGYDTIEWAAAQPWSTGEIGTYGLSYPGAVQWLAAVESPPHLKAMAPAMTFSPRNFFYAGGSWDLSWLSWIWNNIAPDARAKKNLKGPRTEREARAEWKRLQASWPYQDVAPDGTAWNLSSPGTDVLRVSEREGGAERRLLAPGEVAAMRLPNLRTGNFFARGHRVRVVLCGSFMPHFSRNLQTGELETTSTRMQKAVIRIHHEAGRPSRIALPVVP